jgi:hypothetical protein
MNKTTHEDPELLKVIDEATASTSNSIDALDKILNYKKENGLMGFHFSIYPKGDINETLPDNEAIAREIIAIMTEHAAGKTEEVDITNMEY